MYSTVLTKNIRYNDNQSYKSNFFVFRLWLVIKKLKSIEVLFEIYTYIGKYLRLFKLKKKSSNTFSVIT